MEKRISFNGIAAVSKGIIRPRRSSKGSLTVVLGAAVLLLGSGCDKGASGSKSQPTPAASAAPVAHPSANPHAANPHAANPHAGDPHAGKAQPGKPSAAAAKVEVAWEDPKDWKRVQPKSRMRKASYEIPAAAGDSAGAELAVFYFGLDQGGSVEANIGRWIGQFKDIDPKKDAKRSERSANELKQYIVEIEKGTFDSGMPMAGAKGPQKDFALLGAIIETPAGKYFFKMTGPQKTVAAQKNAFFTLLDSVKAAK